MSMTDPIADMLTRIRNGSKARKRAVDVPASKMKRELARVLLDEKFLRDMVEIPDRKQGILRLYLKYSREDEPIIKGLQRVSRPGLRTYYAIDDIKRMGRSQVGIAVMSTSQGLMTNAEAFKRHIGGEVICTVW